MIAAASSILALLHNVIEGNIVQATSRSLWEEVSFDRQKVTSVDWVTYPILDITEAPEKIDIVLLDHPRDTADRCRRALVAPGRRGDRQCDFRRDRRAAPPRAVPAGNAERLVRLVPSAAKRELGRGTGPPISGCPLMPGASSRASNRGDRSDDEANLRVSRPSSRCRQRRQSRPRPQAAATRGRISARTRLPRSLISTSFRVAAAMAPRPIRHHAKPEPQSGHDARADRAAAGWLKRPSIIE